MVDHFWIGALICSVIANSMGTGKGRKPKLKDFLPIMKQRTQSAAEMARAVMLEADD